MERILSILSDIRPEFDFKQADDFITEGMLDSYDMVLLVTELEDKFAITINGLDIVPENFESLVAIAKMLQKYGVAL